MAKDGSDRYLSEINEGDMPHSKAKGTFQTG